MNRILQTFGLLVTWKKMLQTDLFYQVILQLWQFLLLLFFCFLVRFWTCLKDHTEHLLWDRAQQEIDLYWQLMTTGKLLPIRCINFVDCKQNNYSCPQIKIANGKFVWRQHDFDNLDSVIQVWLKCLISLMNSNIAGCLH